MKMWFLLGVTNNLVSTLVTLATRMTNIPVLFNSPKTIYKVLTPGDYSNNNKIIQANVPKIKQHTGGYNCYSKVLFL